MQAISDSKTHGIETGVKLETLKDLIKKASTVPSGFTLDKIVEKHMEDLSNCTSLKWS